ncbi:hypothetical protein EGW08_001467 [Elysia chlorotica]|uniref:Uncharacterized protein n=1 Tax=Elysia chlorotica TaxID=188477 RepID=A0A3S0ZZQ2_ELYCH|nr:hypothetical protein EGW08_001467 [Elysia chlorotica]
MTFTILALAYRSTIMHNYWSNRQRVNCSSPHRHLILLLTGALVLVCQLHSGKALVATACSPNNATPPLSCPTGDWVWLSEEFYVPQGGVADSGPECPFQIQQCNELVTSTGLETNCNGPVGVERCREYVDFDYARTQKECLRNASDLVAAVQYSCVQNTDIFDLCDTTLQLGSQFSSDFQMVYLASPAFPRSSSSGSLCSCTLQGSRLGVKAVQVSVAARLPWQRDVSAGSDFEAVLAIRSKGSTLYKSNECADCTSVDSVNIILVSSSSGASEMTITYSDFGLGHQNVWLQIKELGPQLNISCRSTPLPTDRIITTTTTSTTSATTAAETTTIAKSSAPATMPFPVPNAPVTTSPTTTGGTSSDGGGRGSKTRVPANDSGGDSGDGTTVIVLVVVLLLLLTAGGVLGFVLYRRRGQCGADGKKGVKPMVQAWLRDFQCCGWLKSAERSPGDGQVAEDHGAEAGGFDSALVSHAGSREPVGFTNAGFIDEQPTPGQDPRKPNPRAVEVVETDEGDMTIIHNEVYQAHREMVEGEVARMKRQRREQKAHGLDGTLEDTTSDTPATDTKIGAPNSIDKESSPALYEKCE